MTDLRDFDDLVGRLGLLGDALDLDDAQLAETVLARVHANRNARARRWLVAAATLLVVAAVVAVPDSRDAVARWFGLDGMTIDVDPGVSPSRVSDALDDLGPGETSVVMVDGRRIIVSAIAGNLTERMITKTVGSRDQVEEVEVRGLPGLWISGAPHEVGYESDGDAVFERMAANTLLWQDGDVLFRVEGFNELSDALAFAQGT